METEYVFVAPPNLDYEKIHIDVVKKWIIKDPKYIGDEVFFWVGGSYCKMSKSDFDKIHKYMIDQRNASPAKNEIPNFKVLARNRAESAVRNRDSKHTKAEVEELYRLEQLADCNSLDYIDKDRYWALKSKIDLDRIFVNDREISVSAYAHCEEINLQMHWETLRLLKIMQSWSHKDGESQVTIDNHIKALNKLFT